MKKLVFVLLGLSFAASAAKAVNVDLLEQRSQNAARILEEVVRIPDDAIPESLLRSAQCVATIPNVIRVGFIFGGRFGQGLVSCRVPGGWSAPSFMSIAGASWGFQAGIESIDLVLVFTRANAQEKFSKDNFTLGADATIAAGPLGRDAHIGTDYQLNSEIYSYSRARGLFFGVSLQGTVLSVDHDANHIVYGNALTAGEVLSKDAHQAPGVGMEYVKALESLAHQH